MLPPRMICPECGSTDLNEYCFEGKGVVKTKTIIYVPLPRFQDICPYIVGIIELDEGPMISGMVLGEADKINMETKLRLFTWRRERETPRLQARLDSRP